MCVLAAKESSSILDCIRMSIASRLREVIFPLCLALVQHSWSAVFSFGFNIDILDKVHHRAKKMVNGLKPLSYKERLRELELLNLDKRRLRWILLMCVSI